MTCSVIKQNSCKTILKAFQKASFRKKLWNFFSRIVYPMQEANKHD